MKNLEIINENKSTFEKEKWAVALKRFHESYDSAFKKRIDPDFQRGFMANSKHFETLIIVSPEETLVNISESTAPSTTVYLTNKKALTRVFEIQNGVNLNGEDSRPPLFDIPGGGFNYIALGGIRGWISPFKLNKNSFVALADLNLLIDVNFEAGVESVGAKLFGCTMLFEGTNVEGYIKEFAQSGPAYLESEIYKIYTESDVFRKSLAHPLLRELAQELLAKHAEGKANRREKIPQWKIDEHVAKMNAIAQKHGLGDEYVSKMLADDQYSPISGRLIFYSANEIDFMYQWVLINAGVLFIIAIILSIRNSLPSEAIWTAIAVFVAINGWAFSSKPDALHIRFWILPGILFLLQVFMVAFRPITSFFTDRD